MGFPSYISPQETSSPMIIIILFYFSITNLNEVTFSKELLQMKFWSFCLENTAYIPSWFAVYSTLTTFLPRFTIGLL